jgi:hypothetical protein
MEVNMTSPIFDTHRREHTILEEIQEGMSVYDANNEALGTVDYVYLGEVSPQAAEQGEAQGTVTPFHDPADEFVGMVQRGFGKDNLPRELQERLLLTGFIHVNVPGLLTHNRYVLPDQISQVTDKSVVLRATREELVKE